MSLKYKIYSLYKYIEIRIGNLFKRNRYLFINFKSGLPIKSIKVRSFFFNPFRNHRWKEFTNFLKDNSRYINLKTHDPYLNVRLFDSYEIGGFGDEILFSIIVNLIYDKGKEYLVKFLNSFKSSFKKSGIDDLNGMEFYSSRLKIQFRDKKEIIINLPYPSEKMFNITNIDFNLIEKQFEKSNTALLEYDPVKNIYKKGSIIDTYQ